MLAIRLFYLQILNGATYKADVKESDTTVQTNNVQRGMIYDSTGKVIVGNQAHQAITYTKGSDVTDADMYKIANQLGKYLTVSTEKLTTRNKQDYFLANDDNLNRMIKRRGWPRMSPPIRSQPVSTTRCSSTSTPTRASTS